MLEYGKKLFTSNMTQIFSLFFCFGLAILAKHFSIDTEGLTLDNFISISLDNIFNHDNVFRLGINIILPFTFYLISGSFLLWMSISTFTTFQMEGNKLDMALKILLASSYGLLSVWFIILGGKLAFYFLVFVLTLLLIIAGVIYLISSRTDN
jgi:hypothetical protein